MISTPTSNFSLTVQDSSVVFGHGAAFINNALVPFDGSSVPFTAMTTATSANVYQNVLMYLYVADATRTGMDMTRAVSSTSTNRAAIKYPAMASSQGFPLGVFTFFTDGTTPSLLAYSGI